MVVGDGLPGQKTSRQNGVKIWKSGKANTDNVPYPNSPEPDIRRKVISPGRPEAVPYMA